MVMPLAPLIDDYLLECAITLSKPALKWYTQKLGSLADWAGTDAEISTAMVNRFLTHIQTTPSTRTGTLRSSYTVHGYAQVVKSFARWCEANDLIPKAPKVTMPRVDQKVIEVFSEAQIKQLLAVTRQEETPALVHRDRAALLFLLDTGVRASEFCGLTLDRLHLEAGWAKVIGKGRREREVAFGQSTRVEMVRYLRRYRRGDVAQVFTGKRGEPLTPSGLDQMLYRLGGWAGVEGVRCSAHTFRHTFAVNFLTRGGDLYALSRLMGHSTVKTTEIYLRATTSRQIRTASLSLVDHLGV
jgi:site-specific recombinase XerD